MGSGSSVSSTGTEEPGELGRTSSADETVQAASLCVPGSGVCFLPVFACLLPVSLKPSYLLVYSMFPKSQETKRSTWQKVSRGVLLLFILYFKKMPTWWEFSQFKRSSRNLLGWPLFSAFIKIYVRVFLILFAAVAFSWILECSTAGAKESLSCLYEILKGSKRYSCQMRGFMEALGIA